MIQIAIPSRGQYLLLSELVVDLDPNDLWRHPDNKVVNAQWYNDHYIGFWTKQGVKRVSRTKIQLPKYLVLSLDTIKMNVHWNYIKFVVHRKYNADNNFKGGLSMSIDDVSKSFWSAGRGPGLIDAMYLDDDDNKALVDSKAAFLQELEG